MLQNDSEGSGSWPATPTTQWSGARLRGSSEVGVMTERWVPTGRELDEGAQSPIGPDQSSRRGRLLDRVLGRTRRARAEIEVRPGVGEARRVVQPTQPVAAEPLPRIETPRVEFLASPQPIADTPTVPRVDKSSDRPRPSHSAPPPDTSPSAQPAKQAAARHPRRRTTARPA